MWCSYEKPCRPAAPCLFQGITEYPLALLGAHIGRQGAGLCPIRWHSNVQGDRTMGEPHPGPDRRVVGYRIVAYPGAVHAFTIKEGEGDVEFVCELRTYRGGGEVWFEFDDRVKFFDGQRG